MGSRKLVESLLGVAGIWLVAYQIPAFATSIYLVASGEMPDSDLGPSLLKSQGFHFAATIITGVILLCTRKHIGRWLHPSDADVALSAQPIFAVGVALIAVVLMVSGLGSLSQFFGWRGSGMEQPLLMWSGVASILLGVLLFLASPWVSRLWRGLLRGA